MNKQVPASPKRLFWVYVIQSLQPRKGKRGQKLPGFFYVGMTTDPARRLREHNGLYANGKPGNPNGGRYTSKHRPWEARALHGPYYSRSEALRAEHALKRQKRGAGRLRWSPEDSPLCRGEGPTHPWVSDPTGWHPPTPQQTKDHLSPENEVQEPGRGNELTEQEVDDLLARGRQDRAEVARELRKCTVVRNRFS